MVAKKKVEPEVEPDPKIVAFGNNLNASVALLQAARALDVAAILGEKQSDPAVLLAVAEGWTGISNRLLAGPTDDEDEESTELEAQTEKDPTKFRVGFAAKENEEDE